MEQLSLFPTPYRYIIDTSAILSQKPNELHRRTVHRSQWEKIDELIRNQYRRRQRTDRAAELQI